ncbi:hypothetical protein [Niveibacterium terrae]|uniref:hypothetical protein n=1 Tax=Niveibacterium terrae TaxID=3373598 RepID=UPI003A91C812
MRRVLYAVVLGLFMAGSALAAVGLRIFPADAQRATINAFDGRTMRLGKKDFLVAPGLVIRNQQNVIILANEMYGAKKVEVRVLFDGNGAVWQVWILTPGELQDN